MAELFTRWTVRVALLLYLAALLQLQRRRSGDRSARWLWTLGCGMFFAHVALAFHAFHHWSHAAAYAETARRTAELFGMKWGSGLYFNYLFTLVWAADVLYWWTNGDAAYHWRSPWLAGLIHGFMAFITFNATVVFAHGVVRWVGAAATCLVLAAWIIGRRSQRLHMKEGSLIHE